MKVACVLLPEFQIAVELLRHPELVGKPVVVGGFPHERKSVLSRSQEAAACGVVEGMALREAQGRCPDAIFLPGDDDLYAAVLARVLDTLDAFSPKIEVVTRESLVASRKSGTTLSPKEYRGLSLGERKPSPASNTQRPAPYPVPSPQSSVLVFMDVSGLELLFGPDDELGERIAAAVELRTDLQPRVGVGSGKFVAQTAAAIAAPGTAVVVRSGEEQRFLAPCPARWLPCSEEMHRRLDLYGLRTMEQLAVLPRGVLGEQFGKEGIEVARLARGIDERPIVAREHLSVLREEVEIDPPAESSYLLLAEARLLAKRLESRMRSGYMACGEVTLELGFDGDGTARLSTTLQDPADSADIILRAVDRLLCRVHARISTPEESGPKQDRQDGNEWTGWEGKGEESAEKQGITEPSALRPQASTHHSSRITHHSEVPAVSLLAIALSGFGGLHGEQLELIPTRAASLKKVQQAVRQAEEVFGGGAIRPLAEIGATRPPVQRIRVVAEIDGRPRFLFLNGRWERVQELCNRWRVQEEWWRRELLREYYRLITNSGKLCLIFHDLIGGGWYAERVYG